MPWSYAGLHRQSQSADGGGEEPIQSYSGNPEVLLNWVALKIHRAYGEGLPTVARRLRPPASACFGHGSNAGHSSGVADVGARRVTPPDPRLRGSGLAACRQLDVSHPALVTREDLGVEPCPYRHGSMMGVSG